MSISIAVTYSQPDLATEAALLAHRLQLPMAENNQHYDYLLILSPEYLGLRKTEEKSLPLYIDFLGGKMTYRRQHATSRNEILARAMGVKKNMPLQIIDATGGLGRDSFILASLGCEIQVLERSAIIHALLQDGIKRGLQDNHVAPILNRIRLIQADAIQWLSTLNEKADVIYLDPMFPERQKSALVKKEMRIFHDLIGEDNDADQLLEVALTCSKKRVVVKRPRLAATLSAHKPNFSFIGSSNRFDIYLTAN